MADDYVSVRVDGLKELNDALRELPERIGRNVLRGTAYAGAAVVRDQVKRFAPFYLGNVSKGHPPPGTLIKSIIVKQIPERSNLYEQVYYVTVRHGKKYQKRGQDAYYWKWVEFGHWVNTTGKALGGTNKDAHRLKAMQEGHTTMVDAHPFMRPGFETSKYMAVETMKTYLGDRIDKEVEKLPHFKVLWQQ